MGIGRILAAVIKPPHLHPRCPVRTSLELLGGKWTLLVVKTLAHTPARFGELQQALAPISAKVLADTLSRMQNDGLVELRDGRYALTDAGRAVEPVIGALADFGIAYTALRQAGTASSQ